MEGTDEVPDKSSHDSEDGGRENEVSDHTSSLVHTQVRFLRRCLNNACFSWSDGVVHTLARLEIAGA